MPRFWKHRPDEPIETLLRSNRPVPRDEYVAALLEWIEPSRSRPDLRSLGRRLVLAGVVTALAVGAAWAAGVGQSASSGMATLVQVSEHTFFRADRSQSASRAQSGKQGTRAEGGKSRSGGRGGKDGRGGHHEYPGDHQYAVTICHYTGSRTHPYVELTLSPREAAKDASRFPRDIVPAPPSGCPTSLPPEKHHGHDKGRGHDKGH